MTVMNRFFAGAALIGLTLAAAAMAQSTGPVSALKGHDSNAPVDVNADRIEVQDRADRAVFAGNVKARQGDLTLDTARLTLAYSSNKGSTGSGIQIHRLDASGGVTVTSPTEKGRGDFGVYDLDRKLITLVGNVNLTREGSTINGSRLLIDLNTGRAVIDGGAPGVGQSGGRVVGHFTVPQKTAPQKPGK